LPSIREEKECEVVGFTDIYGKDHEIVIESTEESKAQFISQLMQAADEQDLTINDLGIRAGTSMAATARMQKPDENITLNSMNRFATVVGRKVKITLVPNDKLED
jgi:hypothetical protein